MIQRCKGLLESTDWEVTISRCFRDANQVADVLANIGVELSQDLFILISLLERSSPHCMQTR